MSASEWLFRLLPALIIILVVFINRATAQRELRKRAVADGKDVVPALRLEIMALLQLYEGNLSLMAGGLRPSLSVRTTTSFYRANTYRITVLFDQTTFVPIVDAFTFNESLEAYRSAAIAAMPGNGNNVEAKATLWLNALEEKFTQGCERINAALAALDAVPPAIRGTDAQKSVIPFGLEINPVVDSPKNLRFRAKDNIGPSKFIGRNPESGEITTMATSKTEKVLAPEMREARNRRIYLRTRLEEVRREIKRLQEERTTLAAKLKGASASADPTTHKSSRERRIYVLEHLKSLKNELALLSKERKASTA